MCCRAFIRSQILYSSTSLTKPTSQDHLSGRETIQKDNQQLSYNVQYCANTKVIQYHFKQSYRACRVTTARSQTEQSMLTYLYECPLIQCDVHTRVIHLKGLNVIANNECGACRFQNIHGTQRWKIRSIHRLQASTKPLIQT